MFKKVIAPLQFWLLSQWRCVGCGRELSEAKSVNRSDKTKKVTCTCGRIYIFNPDTKKYRRALLEEV